MILLTWTQTALQGSGLDDLEGITLLESLLVVFLIEIIDKELLGSISLGDRQKVGSIELLER